MSLGAKRTVVAWETLTPEVVVRGTKLALSKNGHDAYF